MLGRFLSCDWGTSSFRLRLIETADGTVLAETSQGVGIAEANEEFFRRHPDGEGRMSFFRNILRSQILILNRTDLDGIPIIISGMASSSIGIADLPYKEIPFRIYDEDLEVLRLLQDARFSHEILLISGLRTKADAMRGEETVLLGCGINDADDHLLIFPGTHSKHVLVKRQIVTEIKTFMTGELFDLLSKKSILSKSVEPNESDEYRDIFFKGVKKGSESNLLQALFQVRTNQLFKSLTATENYHYLSGLLIGTEMKEVASQKMDIILVCGEKLYHNYWTALEMLCGNSRLKFMDADHCLIKGHCRLAEKYF